MTWPAPSGKVNGWPRSHDASNCLPSRKRTPTYWTVTVSPAFAVAPLPLTTSDLTSWVGASPVCRGIVGFFLRLVDFDTTTFVEPLDALLSCVVSVCVSAGWLAWALLVVSVGLSSLPPPPPARARGASSAARGSRRNMAAEASDRSRRGDSNPWPTPYKGVALPAELLRPGAVHATANDVRASPDAVDACYCVVTASSKRPCPFDETTCS